VPALLHPAQIPVATSVRTVDKFSAKTSRQEFAFKLSGQAIDHAGSTAGKAGRQQRNSEAFRGLSRW
jgi:hypothetical protein